MSRIGNTPIQLPKGVSVEPVRPGSEDRQVTVKGPKGVLSRALPPEMLLEIEGDLLRLRRPSEEPRHRALHGLARTLVANLVEGVSKGFQKVLELYGVGYRAQIQGKKLVMQLGFSHTVEVEAPEGISFSLESFVPTSENNYLSARMVVSGIDKELVGQVAANIRASRKPEPYKGKGIRYQGERVRRKAGKAAKIQR